MMPNSSTGTPGLTHRDIGTNPTDAHSGTTPLCNRGCPGAVCVCSELSASGQKTANNNPFVLSKHRRLGGQYISPSITDSNQRQLHAEEAGVSLARDTRLLDFSNTNPF